MSLRAEFRARHPGFPLLEQGDVAGVERFLADRGWLETSESVRACKRAGEGNMNLTLRVETDRRSLVLKQSRPWVEKYDEIPAPWDRTRFEQRFYEHVRGIAGVALRMPAMLYADAEARVIVLEDLPGGRDMTSLYAGDELSPGEVETLAGYLCCLHDATRHGEDAVQEAGLANRDMRALNHQHLFRVPMDPDNGLDLDAHEPGLADAAARLRGDATYREELERTADRYLRDGPCLVHGDYFPGSWLRSERGLHVIDPEFAFPGDPEVDVGCAVAHLALAGQPRSIAAAFCACYGSTLDPAWLARFAAVEVMRRLVGVAQLPLAASPGGPGFRCALLARSREALVQGRFERLFPEPEAP